MTRKEKVLKTIFDHFVNSSDFNGLMASSLAKQLNIDYIVLIKMLKELAQSDSISVISSSNPFIIGFGHYDIATRIKVLEDAKDNKTTIQKIGDIELSVDSKPLGVYPSPTYLKENRDLLEFNDKPYSRMLALAEAQLKPIYFDIEVLDRYFNDPRFKFKFRDYSGDISYLVDDDENALVNEREQIYIKNFGLGRDKYDNRVAVVFLRYLGTLTPELQQYWKTKENNDDCLMYREYHENAINGMWVTSHSVFTAFIAEQKALNDISIAIFGDRLFMQTFDCENKPKEFTFFFVPTLVNYNNFILLLDKMISENINKSFFKNLGVDLYNYIQVEAGVCERLPKGTIALFQDWLKEFYQIPNKAVIDELFIPFKEIRKQRQDPAHKINENKYDKGFSDKQMEIITKAYHSMVCLRKIFQKHPLASGVKIPNWLDDGEISFY